MFAAYEKASDQRFKGPAMASKFGAIAALVRSMTTLPDDLNPHTGVTQFRAGTPPIPAAALSTHDANLLSKYLQTGKPVRVRMELSPQRLPKTTSYNVIAEMTGTEIPQEIVLVGGHLDSWDLSPGAHDDGAGVVQSMEVLRALKILGIRPKRTVRAVLFMCEEFGGIGGDEYAKQAQRKAETHILATESDHGGFKAQGFAIEDRSGRGMKKMREWAQYLSPLEVNDFHTGRSETDVEPLASQGVFTLGLLPDSTHYFDVHHSALDVSLAVHPQELSSGAAAMAIVTYLAAEQGVL
jgi:hypothetical protein